MARDNKNDFNLDKPALQLKPSRNFARWYSGYQDQQGRVRVWKKGEDRNAIIFAWDEYTDLEVIGGTSSVYTPRKSWHPQLCKYL